MIDDDQYAVTKYHYYIKTSIPSTQNHPASLICQYLMTPPIEDCVKWVKRVKCITQLNNEQCFCMKSEHPSILFSVSLSGLQGVVLKAEHLKVIMLRLKRKLFLSFVHQALEQEIFSLFSQVTKVPSVFVGTLITKRFCRSCKGHLLPLDGFSQHWHLGGKHSYL